MTYSFSVKNVPVKTGLAGMFGFLLFMLPIIFMLPIKSRAQENTSFELDNHIVYYNVFSSTMIPPDIAEIYNLVRAKDQVYVNVALVKKTGGNGIPAILSGYHRNLMQQKFELEFIEIKESTATYYLAPIRFFNEEILHIDLTVGSLDKTDMGSVTITKKLYKD